MAKVEFKKGGRFAEGDENLCGQCALKGNCPLKEGLKRTGVIDVPSRTVFCGFYKPEESRGGTHG